MIKRSLLSRLTGWPLLKVPYRSHWRAMMMAHPLIKLLIEDNIDGETRRASLAEWLRAERPVLALYRGTNSRLRIDGPSQIVDYQAFAMGSLIESRGVTAHLDPVETLQLEQRVSEAIEREWASGNIGDVEVEIRSPSDSFDYGPTSGKTALGGTRHVRAAVIESEMRLEPHHGFLQLPDALPVAKIKLTRDHIDARGAPRHPAFIPVDVNRSLWGKLPIKGAEAEAAIKTDGPV